MSISKHSTIVGVFHDVGQAQEAVRDLRKAGFREDQIGVVSHDKGAVKGATESKGSHAAEGALAGVAAGAGVGALWALGIAANILPGIGPVVSGGILGSLLASAAGGAAIAGITGALIGLGIPEEDARYYEGEFKSGHTLITVKDEKRCAEAWSILHAHGAYNKQTPAAATTTRKTGAVRSEDSQTMQVHEEHLQTRKKPVKTGEVHVRKEVVTENQTLQVPVTREEVVIERHPVSGRASTANIKAGEEVRIPVKEEKVQVSKETVVNEEVSIGKRKVQDTETVSGSVRKEKVKVEKEGEVNIRDEAANKKKRR